MRVHSAFGSGLVASFRMILSRKNHVNCGRRDHSLGRRCQTVGEGGSRLNRSVHTSLLLVCGFQAAFGCFKLHLL